MPHSLGHFLGLNVHDVGPSSKSSAKDGPSVASKPLTQLEQMQENMVVTIEPGIYVIDSLFESNKLKEHLDLDLIRQFGKAVGGIRIEDDILIRRGQPAQVLTSRAIKEVDEIEEAMSRTKPQGLFGSIVSHTF